MAFTLSGTTITQTGIDTDLSGLSGIAGVGNYSWSGLDIYDLDTADLHLHISGTLTIGGANSISSKEMLIIRNATSTTRRFEVLNGGTLNLGYVHTSGSDSETVNDGVLVFQPGTIGFGATNNSTNYSNRTSFGVASGGTLNWYSGIVDMAGAVGFQAGANVNIGFDTNTKPVLDQSRVRSTGNPGQILYCYATGLNVNGWKIKANRSLDGSGVTGTGFVLAAVPTQFKGYEPIFMRTAITGSSSVPAGTYSLNDYTGIIGSGDDIQNKAGVAAIVKLINGEKGSDLSIQVDNNLLDPLVVQEVTATASDIVTDNPLISGKAFIARDDGSNAQIVVNDGTGNYDFGEVVIAESEDGQIEGTDLYFGEDDDTTVRHISYETIITSVPAILRGAGGSNLVLKTSVDNSITETNKSTVDAYTTLETAQKFYDRAKAYLVDNYAGETATIVTRSGDTIDLGTYNLTVLQAGNAFVFDGTTVIINSALFEGSVTTSGTVIDLGNAITGVVTDINGTTSPSSITLNTVGVWSIYDNTNTVVTAGTGNTTYSNTRGVDTGTWSVVTHNKGSVAQIFTWDSADGSTNTFTYDNTQLIRPEGGAIYSGGSTTGINVLVNADGYIEVDAPNRAVSSQEIIDAQQDFLNTQAGLDQILATGIVSAPIFGVLNGVSYFLNITGYQYDSVVGLTPESALGAILVSSASHSNIRLDNGGINVVSATESVTPAEIWDYLTTNTLVADSFGESVNKIITNQQTINVGVQKSSIIVPHTTDLN